MDADIGLGDGALYDNRPSAAASIPPPGRPWRTRTPDMSRGDPDGWSASYGSEPPADGRRQRRHGTPCHGGLVRLAAASPNRVL